MFFIYFFPPKCFSSRRWLQALGWSRRVLAHRVRHYPTLRRSLNPPLSVSVSTSPQIVQLPLPHPLPSLLPPTPPRSTSPPAPPPLAVSVSFSFQAWNHLIIAYSFFGRLLNAHLSKAGGNNLPRDITHKHTRTHALSLAHASRERIYYSGSICSSQKSISESRLRKYFCGGEKKSKY